ncbi:MAG: TonB-dependent receptor [Planctomycetota bacterium]
MSIRVAYALFLAAILTAAPATTAWAQELQAAKEAPPASATLTQPSGETQQNQVKQEDLEEDSEETRPAKKMFQLDEMFITATRTPLPILDIPRSVSVIDEKRMGELNSLVGIDALRYEPGIWLEHRTTSTADPIMRGFAGYNILALVDGNTLSSLWGEGGEGADDMYGKIDPDLIGRIEVIRGPASVLYGSNAIGGVINLVTRDPALDYTKQGMETRFRTKGTYGSAAQEYRLRSEIHGATPNFRFMLGGSLHDLDTVQGGRGEGSLVPSDSEAANWDFTSLFKPFGEDHEFGLTYQDTHLTHTKRYHKPDEDNFNDREATSLSYTNTGGNSIWDQLEARIYYQNKEDRRRWLTGPDAGLRGIQKTKTYSGDIQITRLLGDDHRLAYGLHWERDDGESPGDEQLTLSGPGYTQKVKGTPDSVWQDYGVFIQDEWDVVDDLTLIGSARYDTYTFKSTVDRYYVPPLAGQDPNIDAISERKGEFCGGLGLNYHLDDTTTLFANYARGYRLNAPNFGIWLVHGNAYRVPNPFLDPMIADQFEVGAKKTGEGFETTLSTFYTMIKNTQREEPTVYQGSTFYDINGNGTQELAEEEYQYVEVTGGGKADLRGIEFSAQARLDKICDWFGAPNAVDPGWSVRGGFTWQTGEDREVDKPLQFVQPAVGFAALRYDLTEVAHPAWVELDSTFVRRYERVFDDEGREWLRNPQDASSGYYRDYIGVPGYSILNLRGGVELSKNVSLAMAVENLTDKAYRAAHSRMNSPGINFVASLDVWF